MVLMPVYMETAEGLVKPLVILPATIMPLPFLSLPSHDVIIPFVLADSFVPMTHFTPVDTLQIPPTLFIAFVPLFVPIDLLNSGTFSIYGRTM